MKLATHADEPSVWTCHHAFR